jgi:hypothetical protein
MSSEIKASDVIRNYKRRRIVPLPECQLGWACVEVVEVSTDELKTESGALFVPPSGKEAAEEAAHTGKVKAVNRFFVRATAKRWQCNSTEIIDTPFDVGDEVLPEQPQRVRERSEDFSVMLPPRHFMIRIENICCWHPVKMDVSREPKS